MLAVGRLSGDFASRASWRGDPRRSRDRVRAEAASAERPARIVFVGAGGIARCRATTSWSA